MRKLIGPFAETRAKITRSLNCGGDAKDTPMLHGALKQIKARLRLNEQIRKGYLDTKTIFICTQNDALDGVQCTLEDLPFYLVAYQDGESELMLIA